MSEATKRNTDPLLAMCDGVESAVRGAAEKSDATNRILRSRVAELEVDLEYQKQHAETYGRQLLLECDKKCEALEAQLVTAQATIRQQVVEVDRLDADINRLCDMMTKVHEAIHGEESK